METKAAALLASPALLADARAALDAVRSDATRRSIERAAADERFVGDVATALRKAARSPRKHLGSAPADRVRSFALATGFSEAAVAAILVVLAGRAVY